MGLSDSQKKIASNIAWALGGKIVNMASALFIGILVARYLGPNNYGIMNYVISYVSIFSIIASFGLDDIEIRELSKHNENRNIILGSCFFIRIVFATIAYIGIIVSLLFYQTDRLTFSMILVYGLTLFSGTGNIFRNYFTSIVQNRYIVKPEIMRTALGGLIKILLLWLKAPLEYFIYSQILDSIIVGSGYYLSYKSICGTVKNWSIDKKLILFIIKESYPLVISGAAVIIYQRIDQVMIGNMLNKTEVGYFATAAKFVDLIVFLPTVLVQTVTPVLIRTKENNPEAYEAQKRRFVSITTWTAMIMSLTVSQLAYWLIMYTYGKEYALAIPILHIMAFKAVGMALSSSGGQIIIMEGIQKWVFIRNILGCFICILLNYILIPLYGAIGSAIVTLITVLFTGCLANIFIPCYHGIMKTQLYALFMGWKELGYFQKILLKTKA